MTVVAIFTFLRLNSKISKDMPATDQQIYAIVLNKSGSFNY
jgi:hypothetical protein